MSFCTMWKSLILAIMGEKIGVILLEILISIFFNFVPPPTTDEQLF